MCALRYTLLFVGLLGALPGFARYSRDRCPTCPSLLPNWAAVLILIGVGYFLFRVFRKKKGKTG